MPRIIGKIGGILFLLLVCALPAGSRVGSNGLVQELFAKSGLDQPVEQLPRIVQQGMHRAVTQEQTRVSLLNTYRSLSNSENMGKKREI